MTEYELRQTLASTEMIKLALRRVMRAPPWWSGARTPVAFLVAPVAVPLVAPWLFAPGLAEINLGLARIGMVMWYVFFFLLMLALNAAISSAISSIVAGIFDGRIFLEALRIGGPAGAAVGIVLWLIARPDRRVLLECPEPQSKA
jgi:hypothetical protein